MLPLAWLSSKSGAGRSGGEEEGREEEGEEEEEEEDEALLLLPLLRRVCEGGRGASSLPSSSSSLGPAFALCAAREALEWARARARGREVEEGLEAAVARARGRVAAACKK